MKARAADYPERPVWIIVPFAAGSGADVVGRAVGEALSARMGVPVVIENMVGEEGAAGTTAAAKAAPDGYTLLATTSPLTVTPYMLKNPSYDPIKDLVAVAQVAVIPMVLVTGANASYKTFDDLLAAMRKAPGKLAYATSGKGALNHLEVEVLKQHFKVQARDVPHKSDGEAIAATAGGQADFFLANYPTGLEQVRSGALRALAVTSKARMPATPDVPTFAEIMRNPGYEASVWYGVLAPRGTSSQVIARLENEIERELEQPAVIGRIEALGGQVAFLRSAPFGGRIGYEYRKWGQVLKARQVSM